MFAEDRGNGMKAKMRLSLDVLGNDSVAANPQLARTEDEARAGVN